MIIFGTRSSGAYVIKSSTPCHICGSNEHMYAAYSQQYAHVFWIPIFPLGKNWGSYCENCKANFSDRDVLIPVEARRDAKTPKWTFVGLIAIVILFVAFMMLGKKGVEDDKSDLTKVVEAPSVGQVLEVKYEKDYSLLKIVSFTSDSIYFCPHNYYVTKKSALEKLSASDFAEEEEEIVGLSKSEILEKIENREIMKVRK